MSDFVAVESIKDALAECPICTDYFHDPSRIPRRMPCCSQAICEPCLETYIKGRQKLPCPLCRQQHHLPGGVKSLPKEVVVLRFLDVLKTKKDAVPACTDCPDNQKAMAKCENCSIYLCQPCLAAHARNRMSRNHKTVTFEEIAEACSTRSSSTTTQIKSQNELKLKQKLESTKTRLEALATITKNINISKMTASDEINKTFDDLIGEIQLRRGTLLSEVESSANKELQSVTKAVDSHKTVQQKLQKAALGKLSSQSTKALLEETPEDVDYDRRGINFLDLNLQETTNIIREVGDVRTITFTPTKRPHWIDESEPYNAVTLDDINKQKGSLLDQVLVLRKKTIVCPHLEYDLTTSSDDLDFSGAVISNSGSVPSIPNTGCRLKSRRGVLLSRPFVPFESQQDMYIIKVNLKLKRDIDKTQKGGNCGIASNLYPVDVNGTQMSGFNIAVGVCETHAEHTPYLCHKIRYNDDLILCEPVLAKTAGASCNLHLAVLLDYNQRAIHVVDAAKTTLLTTASNVAFNGPLWTKIFLGGPIYQAVQMEVVSGSKIQLSRNMVELLNTL